MGNKFAVVRLKQGRKATSIIDLGREGSFDHSKGATILRKVSPVCQMI
jgi:hypothetical protein